MPGAPSDSGAPTGAGRAGGRGRFAAQDRGYTGSIPLGGTRHGATKSKHADEDDEDD